MSDDHGQQADEVCEDVELARITLTQNLTAGDVVNVLETNTIGGDGIGLSAALGMLELAKHTLIQLAADDDQDNEDDV